MLRNGNYSVWFRTPLGEGTGVVNLTDGKLAGGDTVMAYTGSYTQAGDDFSADIATRDTRRDSFQCSASTRSILRLSENPVAQRHRVEEHHAKRPA